MRVYLYPELCVLGSTGTGLGVQLIVQPTRSSTNRISLI